MDQISPPFTDENQEANEVNDIAKWMAYISVDFRKDDKDLQSISTASQRIESRGHYRLAKIFYDKSDLRKAEIYFNKSIVSADQQEDIYFVFKILGFLIRIASEELDSVKAENHLRLAESLFQKLIRVPTAEFAYYEATIETYRGKFKEARRNFQMALHKAKEENEPEIVAKSLYALSTGHFQNKEFPEALFYLEQLTDLLKIIKKSYLFGSMHLLFGNIYTEMGHNDVALNHYLLANRALQDKTCWNLFGYILLGQGTVYKNKGEFNKALLYFELAANAIDHDIFKRLGHLLQNEVLDVNDSSVDLYLDRANRMVYEKSLGPIDFKHRFVLLEILFLLAQRPGVSFDKEVLAKSIWKDEYNPLIHDKLIYTSVSRLRKLIEPRHEKRKYVIRGKDGYVFNQNVKVRFHRESGHENPPPIANIELSSPV